jgi:hypothetical protein
MRTPTARRPRTAAPACKRSEARALGVSALIHRRVSARPAPGGGALTLRWISADTNSAWASLRGERAAPPGAQRAFTDAGRPSESTELKHESSP